MISMLLPVSSGNGRSVIGNPRSLSGGQTFTPSFLSKFEITAAVQSGNACTTQEHPPLPGGWVAELS